MKAPSAELRPLAWKDVTIEDRFWAPRQKTNREVTMPHVYRMCKETGRIDALRLQWKAGDPNPPHIFRESDVGKWVEAAAYSLATHPDDQLDKLADEVIDLFAGAQQGDGYLNAHYTVVEPGRRWTNLRDCHELYCAGHLIEAAVAHFQATGKRKLLDVLCRYADHIDSVFGPEEGKKRGYCGHEEIELALVKLYRATGNGRYLKLGKYFIDERGRQPHYYNLEAAQRGEDPKRYSAKDYSYSQAHIPLRQQSEVVGHAVRAFYCYSGMADIAALTGDAELLSACKRLWKDLTRHKLYITGGIGPSKHNEGFTQQYDLPNQSAYAETCAAIALVFFAHRMLQVEADARYADVMEQALYNGVLSGVSLDGAKFFYVNPLASAGGHHRQDWFGCACCPPNVARLLASLGSYVYSAAPGAAYVHLYVAGKATATVDGQELTLLQETDYPWDGDVKITLRLPRAAKLDLMLRVPGWCRQHKATLNGKPVAGAIAKGYLRLRREWKDGDVVKLSLAMPVERVAAHPSVIDDVGKVALQRGPIVYCLEQCDNAAPVRSVVLPDKAKLTARRNGRKLGGIVEITGPALAPAPKAWKSALYLRADQARLRPVTIKAVPYCLWDNRRPGAMTVWLARTR